jgi:non-specific serine/threonine protein kinase
MQTDEDEFLFCTPDLRLCAGAASSRRIREAFDESDANGVLYLATQCLKSDLAAPLVWAREWGKSFLTELCHTRDPRLVRAPDERLLSMMAASAPPMNGGEYLGEDLLRRLWTDLQDTSQRLADACGEGNEDWLKSLGGGWHLVGRVTFHLAENRRSLEKPFAFLATYTEQLSADCAAQHIPLGRVLTSQEKAPVLLDALLEPVSLAAAESALVRDLLQSRRLFQALAWTSQEAYAFLKEIPLLEQCGIVVKLPDWWKARRPARPAVSVSVEAPEAGNLGVSAMLSFRCQVTLGGEVLTDAEMALIRASPTGLLSLRGQWVEVNSEQLQQALDHWEKVQVYHENGVIPFHEGMRWLAGFSNRSPGQATGEAEPRVAEWSEVVAGKDLNAWLQRLKNPTEMDAVPGLQAVLRPYQRKGVAWLYFAAQLGLGVCLADDMGLGKTVQVIA